jgi:enoyl-CoA hydratase/carnithine racemase
MSSIEVTVHGAVRSVTLNRPEKRNALSPDMLARLTEIFSETPGPDERVATIGAVGPVFCSGIDLRERDASATGARHIERLLDAIQSWPLPVVAIVEGSAYAGGAELALHCDLVVASTAASFGMPLAQIGLAPSWFLSKKIIESLGPAGARELLLLGDPVPAQRLYDLGAISHVAEPETLALLAEQIVTRCCANAPLALRAIKSVINRAMSFRDDLPYADLDALVGSVRTSADAHEGMAARLERRPPVFRGR